MPLHTCSQCSRSFTRYFNMMRHQQQVHPEKFDHKLDRDESDYNADEEDDIESVETNSNISKTEEKDIDDYIRSSDDDLEGKEDVDENIPHKYSVLSSSDTS